jgi:glyoxylase-like metal-dependent hydrolase (beta-lactamase superfamily II)
MEAAGLTNPVSISINAYLLDDGKRRLLLDTGAGDLMGASAGQLLASLAQAGYHPNAELYVNALDANYWLSEANQQRAPAARQRSFVNARRKVLPYQLAGRLHTFTAGEEVLPGVGTIAQPGHTPGHTYYTLSGTGPRLVFCADLAHLLALQLADPTIALVYDVNPDQAIASRQRFLAEASAGDYWLAAAHAPFPGVGQVEAHGAGYHWQPLRPGRDAL